MSGQAVTNVITCLRTDFSGRSVYPTAEARRIDVGGAFFLRGDSNGDGRVDISDAIRAFMYLFQDALPPGCLDAADATDDGRVDISDGIRILLDFSVPDTEIPSPGPFSCGPDPTPDALDCVTPAPCVGGAE